MSERSGRVITHPDVIETKMNELLDRIEAGDPAVQLIDFGDTPVFDELRQARVFISRMYRGQGPIGWVKRKIMRWAVLKYLRDSELFLDGCIDIEIGGSTGYVPWSQRHDGQERENME